MAAISTGPQRCANWASNIILSVAKWCKAASKPPASAPSDVGAGRPAHPRRKTRLILALGKRLVEIRQRRSQPFFQVDLGLPLQNPLGLGDVRAPLLRIVLRQWLENNRRSVVKMLPDLLREFQDRNFLGIPNVRRQMFVRHRQLVNAIDQVGYVAEAARRFPVALPRVRLPVRGLVHKIRRRAPIVQAHSWSI